MKSIIFLIISLFSFSTFSMNPVLEKEIRKFQPNKFLNLTLEVFLELEPSPQMVQEIDAFNEGVLENLYFLNRLHPYEQKVFYDMVRVFSKYENYFTSYAVLLNEIGAYQHLFTSYLSEKRRAYFKRISQKTWENASHDPAVFAKLMGYYPLEAELQSYEDYWSALLLEENPLQLPPWDLFQREMGDIRRWYVVDPPAALHAEEEPLFLWEGRFDEEARQRLNTLQHAISDRPPTWNIDDKGLELDVVGTVVVNKPIEVVKNNTLNGDKVELFKRVFPWNIVSASYDEANRTLTTKILLQTKNEYELTFSVSERIRENSCRIYFTLNIPTLSEMNLAVKNWELSYEVKQHEKFQDMSVVSLDSTTLLRFEWARKKLAIPQTKEDLKVKLPAMLSNLKTYTEGL